MEMRIPSGSGTTHICVERQRCNGNVWIYDFWEKLLGHDNLTILSLFGSMFMERNDLVMTLVPLYILF